MKSLCCVILLSALLITTTEGRLGSGDGTNNRTGGDSPSDGPIGKMHGLRANWRINNNSNNNTVDSNGYSIESASAEVVPVADVILIEKSVTSTNTRSSTNISTAAIPSTVLSSSASSSSSKSNQDTNSETITSSARPLRGKPLPTYAEVMNTAPSHGRYVDYDTISSFCARHNKFSSNCEQQQQHASLRGSITAAEGQHQHHHRHHSEQEQEQTIKTRSD